MKIYLQFIICLLLNFSLSDYDFLPRVLICFGVLCLLNFLNRCGKDKK